jgi:hypothetical protein
MLSNSSVLLDDQEHIGMICPGLPLPLCCIRKQYEAGGPKLVDACTKTLLLILRLLDLMGVVMLRGLRSALWCMGLVGRSICVTIHCHCVCFERGSTCWEWKLHACTT